MRDVVETADYLGLSLLDAKQRSYKELAKNRYRAQKMYPEIVVQLSSVSIENALIQHPESFKRNGKGIMRVSEFSHTFSFNSIVKTYDDGIPAAWLAGIRTLFNGNATTQKETQTKPDEQ